MWYHLSTCSERDVVLAKELGKILANFGENMFFFVKFPEVEDKGEVFFFDDDDDDYVQSNSWWWADFFFRWLDDVWNLTYQTISRCVFCGSTGHWGEPDVADEAVATAGTQGASVGIGYAVDVLFFKKATMKTSNLYFFWTMVMHIIRFVLIISEDESDIITKLWPNQQVFYPHRSLFWLYHLLVVEPGRALKKARVFHLENSHLAGIESDGIWWNKGVSKNSGTPKSSILIGFYNINHPFWGTTIFGNTHTEYTLGSKTFTMMITYSV